MRKYLLLICFSLFSLFFAYGVHAEDLLSKVFKQSNSRQYTIDVGNTKDSVGDSFTKKSSTIYLLSDKDKDNLPLLANIADFLLKFTVALAVTMIIYNAVLYGVRVVGGDDYKSKDSLKKLKYVLIGIVLALSSIVIINLVRSISTTFTSIR